MNKFTDESQIPAEVSSAFYEEVGADPSGMLLFVANWGHASRDEDFAGVQRVADGWAAIAHHMTNKAERLEEVVRNYGRSDAELYEHLAAMQTELTTLRALRDEWQEIVNARSFEEAVEHAARHYHDHACRYQLEIAELRGDS